jgi:hypothetical protein
MNDFGFALAWLAIQVAIVLTPALVLNAIASRRQPASGAWVAAWSLGLSIILGLLVFFPRIETPSSGNPRLRGYPVMIRHRKLLSAQETRSTYK